MAGSQVTIPCSEKRNPVKATGPFLTRVEPLALDPIFHEGGSREGLEGGAFVASSGSFRQFRSANPPARETGGVVIGTGDRTTDGRRRRTRTDRGRTRTGEHLALNDPAPVEPVIWTGGRSSGEGEAEGGKVVCRPPRPNRRH